MKYIVLLLALTACTSSPSIAPTESGEYCSLAQEHLNAMCSFNPTDNKYCCDVVAPTKKGKSFGDFCREKVNQGLNMNSQCLSEVSSCGEIDTCENTAH